MPHNRKNHVQNLFVTELMSEFIVPQRLLAGLNKHAFHGAPPGVLVWGAHAVHLALATDRMAILLACNTEEDLCAHVFEADWVITLPVDSLTLDSPHIQIITLSVLSKGADFL
ncbi:hypothetical protein ILYODFUR_034864 [Ilyodon furcidens]|uniref:Uncharacterized protein n=1 Tax=Ilyodon furcidens TaxID=33524 RepID=A0ABV0THJ2_9TELE